MVDEAVLVGVIVGLVEIIKRSGVPDKYSPIVAIFLGVISGVLYLSPDNYLNGVLQGIILGLSSVGLYSGTKNLIGKGDH